VTAVVVLLVVLALPIVLWAVVRWLPGRRGRPVPERPVAGPRKRWWQP